MKPKKPYKPSVTLADILAFDPAEESTFTRSPFLNAVLEAIPQLQPLLQSALAEYLCLSRQEINIGVKLATGMTYSQMLDAVRTERLNLIRTAQPELSSDHLARLLGFSDRSSIWHLEHRQLRKKEYKKMKENRIYFSALPPEQKEELYKSFDVHGRPRRSQQADSARPADETHKPE